MPPCFPLGAAITPEQLHRDPHRLLAALREREPVSWLPQLGGWLVTRYDLVLEALRDPVTFTVQDPRFTTARVTGPSMLSLDGPEHTRHRAPFTGPFRPGAIRERFTATVTEEAARLTEELTRAGGGELRRAFAGPLAAATVARALGLGRAETPQLLSWYDAIVASVNAMSAGGEPSRAGAEAYAALAARLERSMTNRGQDDAESLLSAAAKSSGLTHVELAAGAAVLLFGGIETTEGMLANALLLLLRDPPELERVRAEPARLEAALEESLRLEPAAAALDRYTTDEVVLGEARIPRRALVRLSITAANRDPAVFVQPNSFDPGRGRAGRTHLSFAQGPHVCVGVHLARLEARLGLTALLERLPRLRLDPRHEAEIRGLVFRKPPRLDCLWS